MMTKDEARLMLREQRYEYERRLAPTKSFIRGVVVGAVFIGGINTLIPGQFGVVEWPVWVRALFAVPMLLLCVHYLMRQRGYSRILSYTHAAKANMR